MSEDPRLAQDHEYFKILIKKVVLSLKESGLDDDPRVLLYEDIKAFQKEWSDPEERKEMMASLERNFEAFDKAFIDVKDSGLLDLFSENEKFKQKRPRKKNDGEKNSDEEREL